MHNYTVNMIWIQYKHNIRIKLKKILYKVYIHIYILSFYILIWCIKCIEVETTTKALWDVRLCQDAFGVLPGLDVSLLENSEAVGFEVSWSTKFGLPGKMSHLISPKSYTNNSFWVLNGLWYVYIYASCMSLCIYVHIWIYCEILLRPS